MIKAAMHQIFRKNGHDMLILRPRGRHTKPIWRIEKWWIREIWGGEVMHITRAQAAQAVHRGR